MKFLLPVLLLLLIGSACGPASAQVPAAEPLRGHVVLRGKRLPLPPGDWIRLAHGYGRVEGDWPGAYGAIESVLLASVRDNQVQALALLQTNVLPVEAGWGVPAGCETAAFVTATRVSARNIACAYAEVQDLASPGLRRLPVWQAGLEESQRRGLTIPRRLAFAVARVGDRQDVLEARYAFTPGTFGLTGAAQAVAPDSSLAGWTRQMESRLEAALLAPGAAVPALPPPGQAAAATAEAGEIPVWQLSLYKLATNRIMQTAISFGIGLVLTADAYASTSLALWQSVTHSLVYYGNELIWEWPTPPTRMEFVAEVRP
ncbi:MAG: DUF2061 domain-containing protein [Acetobacteraceae bacterium]